MSLKVTAPMTTRQIQSYLQKSQLYQAIDYLTCLLKYQPDQKEMRALLSALLCLSGDLARADKQLEIINTQNSAAATGTVLLRQLIRAEQHRRQCFFSGKLPQFIDRPTPSLQFHLQALIEKRDQKFAQARHFLAQAREQYPIIRGSCNNKSFTHFFDMDDYCAGFFEILTSNGNYYWLSPSQIKMMDFAPVEGIMDLLWHPLHITLTNGTESKVYMPAIYINTPAHDESALLGEKTEWHNNNSAPVYGLGQRLFLLEDTAVSIREINHLVIQNV